MGFKTPGGAGGGGIACNKANYEEFGLYEFFF